MENIESILISIKKPNGVSAEDKSFDTDIIMHINSTFMILTQLGVGPSEGFYIDDDVPKWTDFIPNRLIAEAVKTFVYIKVRLVFDPPASPTVVDALKSQADEQQWRLVRWAEDHK